MTAGIGIDVGSHLRAIRQLHGLSQRELAKRTGVTNGMISLIEQNRVSPSVSSLKKILDGIPMSLAEFFTMDLAVPPPVFYARAELTEISAAPVELRLVAAGRPQRAISILHARYAPGADTGPEMRSHPGEEGGVVVRGRIEVTAGSASRVLGAGDAYYFSTAAPHRFRNPGDDDCEIISARTPPGP